MAKNPEIALEREVSQSIIKTYIQDIAAALNAFSQNNLSDLKKTLLTKRRKSFVPGMKPTVHEVKG
jgi:DNA-binding NarL/FixJ family response regulator